jgi:hypothetical protein
MDLIYFKYGYILQIIWYIILKTDPNYVIYMGRDKYENEELLKYAFDIDIWFHVDGLSSAHVYLRLPEGINIDTIPTNILNECFQLVKDNSKEGRKKDKVGINYTPANNLLKTSSMDIGEVGYKKENLVKIINGVEKDNEILKVIKKTMEEKQINLEAEKESYDKEVANKKKKYYEEKRRLEVEEAQRNKLLKKDKQYDFIDKLGESRSNKEKRDLDDDFW